MSYACIGTILTFICMELQWIRGKYVGLLVDILQLLATLFRMFLSADIRKQG